MKQIDGTKLPPELENPFDVFMSMLASSVVNVLHSAGITPNMVTLASFLCAVAAFPSGVGSCVVVGGCVSHELSRVACGWSAYEGGYVGPVFVSVQELCIAQVDEESVAESASVIVEQNNVPEFVVTLAEILASVMC
eukprot:jgi/Astpho2/5809/Aster-02323